jgi:polyisoprenoid-binding protein YceI
MKARLLLRSLAVLTLALAPALAMAQQMTFTALRNSSATFKTDAPLETVVGTTAGGAVSGTVTGDPARPQAATGTIRVDLSTLKTGIEKRDADLRSKNYLDTENEANRFAVFVLKGVEIGGPLDPGKEVPAKLKGTLTVKERPVDITADARITYVKLTPDQLESQKRFGFTSDNIRLKVKFNTSFTNHGMQIPELMFMKLSNDIQLETDLTLVRQ